MVSDDKRELILEFSRIEKEHKGFKKRVSIIMNLLIPGAGFYIYSDNVKVSIIIFMVYVLLLFIANNFINHHMYESISSIIIFIIAGLVNIMSTASLLGNN